MVSTVCVSNLSVRRGPRERKEIWWVPRVPILRYGSLLLKTTNPSPTCLKTFILFDDTLHVLVSLVSQECPHRRCQSGYAWVRFYHVRIVQCHAGVLVNIMHASTQVVFVCVGVFLIARRLGRLTSCSRVLLCTSGVCVSVWSALFFVLFFKNRLIDLSRFFPPQALPANWGEAVAFKVKGFKKGGRTCLLIWGSLIPPFPPRCVSHLFICLLPGTERSEGWHRSTGSHGHSRKGCRCCSVSSLFFFFFLPLEI